MTKNRQFGDDSAFVADVRSSREAKRACIPAWRSPASVIFVRAWSGQVFESGEVRRPESPMLQIAA
jgi:hypothetical protein